MRERWIVRLLVDYDPETDALPSEWGWDIPDANVVVHSSQCVGLIAPPRPLKDQVCVGEKL